jgi:hypothetical protein
MRRKSAKAPIPFRNSAKGDFVKREGVVVGDLVAEPDRRLETGGFLDTVKRDRCQIEEPRLEHAVERDAPPVEGEMDTVEIDPA